MIKIETYWNVNLNENTKQMTELIIKIETYWNVNTLLRFFKVEQLELK